MANMFHKFFKNVKKGPGPSGRPANTQRIEKAIARRPPTGLVRSVAQSLDVPDGALERALSSGKVKEHELWGIQADQLERGYQGGTVGSRQWGVRFEGKVISATPGVVLTGANKSAVYGLEQAKASLALGVSKNLITAMTNTLGTLTYFTSASLGLGEIVTVMGVVISLVQSPLNMVEQTVNITVSGKGFRESSAINAPQTQTFTATFNSVKEEILVLFVYPVDTAKSYATVASAVGASPSPAVLDVEVTVSGGSNLNGSVTPITAGSDALQRVLPITY